MNLFSKQPAEIFPISMDYQYRLQTGETITSATITATTNIGITATSSIISTQSISGTIVKVVVQNGINKNRYKITFRATTDESNIYEEDVYMDVLEI